MTDLGLRREQTVWNDISQSVATIHHDDYPTPKIYTRLMQLMLIHSSTPWIRGRRPTLRNVSLVSDAPIKKSESVMRCLASLLTAPLNSPPIAAAPSPISEALLNI